MPIDPHGEIETITNFLENSEAKVAFLSPDLTRKVSADRRKTRSSYSGGCLAHEWREEKSAEKLDETELGISKNGFQKFEDWSTTEFPESFAEQETPAKDEDTALLMYTSGTTGTPKGVPLTHGNITAELDGIYKRSKIKQR